MSSTAQDEGKPYARVAKPEELEQAIKILGEAFRQDPAFNFFGCVKQLPEPESAAAAGVETMIRCLLRICYVIGGRVTVVVVPEGSEERIAAAAIWMPPKMRLSHWNIFTLLRCGLPSVAKAWGLGGLMRFGFEYPATSHLAMEVGYKKKGSPEDPDNSWYLQIVGTATAFQGRGLMSLLMREGYAHAPNAIFTLEATTAKSRDQYCHLGYEVVEPLRLGAGAVSVMGLPATGEDAVGVECYAMANVS
ncbi:hypothetical protein BDQ12DRAFT_610441 [Crucibulum laeve]|uniref:N-acetyltransferase domain-containing protein n=1 Tax=Crucibulum laeve TaxID=68775 RepID=A0A5C3LTK9_9AGAR|nr:hypothetical protein BDQ12DRAFT_610441 [Crucibulum laeve]